MSTEAQAAAEGPLSVDQAVGLLDVAPPEVEQPEEQPPEAEIESEAEPTADETPDPEQAIEGEEDAEPESDPEAPAIAAPQSWAAEERALFETLPADAKKIIAERAVEDGRAVSKALQESNEAKKAVAAELQGIAPLKAALEAIVPRAQQVFQDRWANIDWVEWARQDPSAYAVGKEQYAAEQLDLMAAQATQQQARQAEQRAFLSAETDKLNTLAKTDKAAAMLVDPAKGVETRKAVATYLISQGADPASLDTLPANAVLIAHKAHLYDQLQAGVQGKPQPRPASATPAVRPTAQVQARTPQIEADKLSNRFAQTGDVETAIALLNARSARKAS